MKSTHMILLLMSVMACRAEVPLGGTSFEKDSDLAHFSGTGFAVVADRAQFGSKSLKWGGGILTVSNIGSLSPEESGAKYGAQFPVSPTFVMSLYNEAPAEEVLRIEFNGTVHFDLQLNFKGWRTVWVPFYEMQGDVPEAGSPYDVHSARLIAPETAGALWIDDLVFSQYIDDRHAYPDLQVPFIKNGGAGVWDHWMPKLDHWKRIAAVTPDPVTPLVFKELETIRLRLIDEYFKKSKQLFGADWYRSKLVDDGILAEDGAVGFSPVPLRLDVQVSPVRYELGLDDKPEYIVVRPFGIRMLQLANEYRSTVDLSARAELGRVYAAACHYVLDQGWCAGSSLGTMHHFGYQLRELMTSFFLMKEVLAEEGLLDDIGDTTLWMLDCGEMLMPQETFEANLDYYNTQSAFRLMVALLPADPGRQSALLKAYSAHLSYSLALTDSTGGFKPDGTAWHHWGHYPAYATGAFDRIPITFYALSGTSFRIDEAGHSNFKKAMLAATLYSNPFCYGLGQAGRHPLGGSIKSLGEAYLKLALSGTPDGAEPLDAEVAAAYQRLWGVPNDQVAKALFATCNLNTEPPNGHWTFPYAALSVHRRADWSVNIKGYSKYVWASEIYNLDNRYGRYQSSGVVQVLPNLSQKEAGYTEDGWDWNHPPGATTIERPFAELEPEAPLVMFKSEESYAGGCSLDGNGVWAMKLNEGDGFTIDPVKEKMSFPGKLKARKSVFCFGEQILCLGSGIESDDPSAPVHTTLFQNSIKPIDGAVRREGDWLFDPIGNGYKILDGAEPVITVGEQSSPNNKYSLRKGEGKKGAKADASGLFAKAWIDHGAASKNASYAYVVFPMVGTSAPRDTPFSIRRQDNQAHVVEWESTTAYACFEAGGLKEGLLESISVPCYVMIQEADLLKVSVANPDLNQEEDPVKGHFNGPSKEASVTLRLKGLWKIKGSAPAWTEAAGDSTLLTVKCKDGASMEVELEMGEDQALFEAAKALNWKPVFSGKSSKDWKLDGEFARITDIADGLEFSAGSEEWNHAHHAVLWTKDSFQGDLKIEYEYTRLDDINKWVNILYIEATGKGGEFAPDIMDWAEVRKEPWMKNYFETMKLLHISYAAYGADDNGPDDDYVRCRRYPKADDGEFSKTEIKPDSFRTGLFRTGKTYHITAIKKGSRLFFNVAGDGQEKLFAWQSPLIGEVTEGRIGLRHMWMKSARYKDFTVSVLGD